MVHSNAWLLASGVERHLAVAESEMVEYVLSPAMHAVPLTPKYCGFAMFWRDGIIPVVSYEVLLGEQSDLPGNRAVVLAYQLGPGTPLEYLAMVVSEAPRRIRVSDDQICDLPEYLIQKALPLALSCFRYEEEAIPILNLRYLSSRELRDQALGASSEAVLKPSGAQAEQGARR